MSFKIRELLDCLREEDSRVIQRLCDLRDIRARSLDDKCAGLARSYRGDHDEFLSDLLKPELALLLTTPTLLDDGEYVLRSANSYSKQDLLNMAIRLFRDEELPSALERISSDEDDDELDDESDDDELDDESDDDNDETDDAADDEFKYGSRDSFDAEFVYSPSDAGAGLRDYQSEAITALMPALKGGSPLVLHLATGGGKTRTANELAARWIADRQRGGPVLWVTKDWRLLRQAAIAARRCNAHIRLVRIGGARKDLARLDHYRSRSGSDIIYSTVQTVQRRIGKRRLLDRVQPSLVVWDECHWGEHGGTGREILDACRERDIPVLGLTATPREPERSKYRIGYSKTFSELVESGVLARPELVAPVGTGIQWKPTLRHNEFSRTSLTELARNQQRNKRIVEHYASNAEKYGKTLVFACDMRHANELTALFSNVLGVSARVVHSDQDPPRNAKALEEFRTGAVNVLVSVEMLTTGIDVPDARTVFLCRPTASDILFMQMVGRAARRDVRSGKKTFYIVEFTDNLDAHGDKLVSAVKFFSGAGNDESNRHTAGKPLGVRVRGAHAFDPKGAPTWIPNTDSIPGSARGLWYREGQTFGIEFELTKPNGGAPQPGHEWLETAEELRTRLAAALPERVARKVTTAYQGISGDKDHSVWNVEHDTSAGWEVTSRILEGLDGYIEIDEACSVLENAAHSLNLKVNFRTGTHVHLGWDTRDFGQLTRAIRLARLFEPGLGTLVSPSRIVRFDPAANDYDLSQPNEYCRPVATVFSARALAQANTRDDLLRMLDHDSRYVTLNLNPLGSAETVEVRLHNGTLEARKILLWVSLWQQILWAASSHASIPDVPDIAVIEPTADILHLAQQWLPEARQPEQQALLRRLVERRTEIVEGQWRRHPRFAPWVDAARRWSA